MQCLSNLYTILYQCKSLHGDFIFSRLYLNTSCIHFCTLYFIIFFSSFVWKHKLYFLRSSTLQWSSKASYLPYYTIHNPTHSYQITDSPHLFTIPGKIYIPTANTSSLKSLDPAFTSDDPKPLFCYLLFFLYSVSKIWFVFLRLSDILTH